MKRLVSWFRSFPLLGARPRHMYILGCVAAVLLVMNWVTWQVRPLEACVREQLESSSEDGLVIAFQEDGRFGNLLLETATLVLVGRRVNQPVYLLPQVGRKLRQYFHSLPRPVVDNRKHCVCSVCTECLCEQCTEWQRIASYRYQEDTVLSSKYILLLWFDSSLVLQNIEEMAAMYKSLLRQDLLQQVQGYLRREGGPPDLVYVGVHVRRTDYIGWVEHRYKGNIVDETYFKHCMNYFRSRFSMVRFFVTSDDISWCKAKLTDQDVVFPQLADNQTNTAEQDFLLMTQMNHTIYDYGSFGFWSAVLAGGYTLVADNYSNRTHPLLEAIRRYPPRNWTTINVQTI